MVSGQNTPSSGSPFERKRFPKCAFWEIQKIVNGTKIQLFIKVQHAPPLKTVPGSGLEKTWKVDENTIRKTIFFYNPKPLKRIEKQILFLISGHSKNNEKTIQKGLLKVIVCAGRDRRTQGKSANPDRKDGVLESAGNGEPAPWSNMPNSAWWSLCYHLHSTEISPESQGTTGTFCACFRLCFPSTMI